MLLLVDNDLGLVVLPRLYCGTTRGDLWFLLESSRVAAAHSGSISLGISFIWLALFSFYDCVGWARVATLLTTSLLVVGLSWCPPFWQVSIPLAWLSSVSGSLAGSQVACFALTVKPPWRAYLYVPFGLAGTGWFLAWFVSAGTTGHHVLAYCSMLSAIVLTLDAPGATRRLWFTLLSCAVVSGMLAVATAQHVLFLGGHACCFFLGLTQACAQVQEPPRQNVEIPVQEIAIQNVEIQVQEHPKVEIQQVPNSDLSA